MGLLEKGANVDVAENKWTSLHTAAYFGKIEEVNILLKKGVDVSVVSENGMTAFCVAVMNGHAEVASALLERGANIEAVNNYGWTYLHIAAQRGHENVVSLLLTKGAHVNAKDRREQTALYMAAGMEHVGVVEVLLRMGANVVAVDDGGWTALHIAAGKEHVGVVEVLLRMGANVVAVDNYGETPLHIAAHKGYEGVASLLLEKGASVRAKNRSGQTALHIAAIRGRVGVAEVLLQMGADVHAVDNWGKTALCYAEEINNAQLKKILKDFSSQQKPVMLGEAETSQSSCLLKQGEGVKVLDIPNAEEVNLTEKKEQQLKAVDLADKERQIVFDVTAKKENEEVEKFLVDASSPLLRREYFNSDKVSIQPRALQEEEFVCSNDSLRFSLTRASHLNQPSFSGVMSQVQELYFCDGHFVARPLEYGEQMEDCIESEEEGFLWVGPSKPGC